MASTPLPRRPLQGLFKEAATGFFGEKTEKAVRKWRAQERVGQGAGPSGVPESGRLWDWETRAKYARKHGLPPPGRMDAKSRGPGGEGKTCIDVCSELGGYQDCATRCVADPADRSHACGEACQVAFGAACDRAFPSGQDAGGENYKACLSQLAQSCANTCREYGT